VLVEAQEVEGEQGGQKRRLGGKEILRAKAIGGHVVFKPENRNEKGRDGTML